MATYRVLNPRGIPKGRHILRVGDKRWYEGDEFDPPRGIDLERFIVGGFITDGKAKGRGAVGDVPEVPSPPRRSRRVVEPKAADVPAGEEVSDG